MSTPSTPVSARVERITIPTYGVGQPQKNPMFLEKRVYQGSSGAVYPHPVVERVEETKAPKEYTAIFLENAYLLIMLLPELGGRVQMALDKTNDYHFVYYNRVIKPALVGLAGPWISGGIEFNWPQHHRPSTFEPVDYRLEEGADGSQTVWMSEIERMFRTQGAAGFRLYPDRAYLEIDVRLYNRTPFPQTFLWWANPAVHVNDDYQSLFPPDVFAVMDHGKRAVSSFPIATGTYYKVNYAPGADISRYKNIPVPTSYMAYHSDFDFLGCYDHGRQAGMLHVANHHLAPGKKQWTWGHSNFGQTWDRQLTDEDGPYIELMCGAFTDNQPDFSWLQPGEEKRFTQVFMPFKAIGGVKNASKEVAINLEIDGGLAVIGVYVTSPRTVTVTLTAEGATLFQQQAALSPEKVLQTTIALPPGVAPQAVTLTVTEGARQLIAFTPLPAMQPAPPEPATPAQPPAAIASNEELFLNGLHLEQYRHATYDPEPYYQEALRRDPLDSRCNNALGLRRLRQGQFAAAESFLRQAVRSLTRRNPNPYDGEPYYNLGLALRLQGRWVEARDAFYKAVWNAAWQDAGYYELARLAARQGDREEALALAVRCRERNGRHAGALLLQAALLRATGRRDAAVAAVTDGLAADPMHYGLWYEHFLLTGEPTFHDLVQADAHTCIELALEYTHAGFFAEAAQLLDQVGLNEPRVGTSMHRVRAREGGHDASMSLRVAYSPLPALDQMHGESSDARHQEGQLQPDRALAAAWPANPMVHYYLGWIRAQAGDLAGAEVAFAAGAAAPPDYCFPNEVECVPALTTALAHNPNDARAAYYLGTFFYAHRVHAAAILYWERAAALAPDFPTVHRNLGLAYMNKRGDAAAAHASYVRAFALDPTDARVFFELDQLDKKLGVAPATRLAHLREHLPLVMQRDDLTVEYVTLLNLAGQHDAALELLLQRTFHPWEGGEGKVSGQYVVALVELAKARLAAGEPAAAIVLLNRARTYPDNLAEGKLAGAQENQIDYWLGEAYAQLGDPARAAQYYRAASEGSTALGAAMYYNDQPPELIYYQALAHAALGDQARAAAIFRTLVAYGEAHQDDEVQMDYFAVSLPDFLVFDDDLSRRNRIHCLFMAGLGQLGLGESEAAAAAFAAVLALEPAHLGAALAVKLVANCGASRAGQTLS